MTKDELERENSVLKERIEELEIALSDRDVGAMKTRFMMRFYAIGLALITLIQSSFAALGRPSPFTGGFAWMIVAFAVLILAGYSLEIAMHRGKSLGFRAKLGAHGTEIAASVGEQKVREG